MPVKVRKVRGGYRVTEGGHVRAKRTSKAKATRQARLLNAIRHGFTPTRGRR